MEDAPGEGSTELTGIWAGVDQLIDRSPRLSDLELHGLDLLAARSWRIRGLPVPAHLVEEERRAAALSLAVPTVLERARAAYDGEMMLLKGPEVAACYPDSALRKFRDLDVLVADAAQAQAAFQATGFEPVGDPNLFVDIHHLRPLWLPGLPLLVELHSQPKWLNRIPPPPIAELFSTATPSSTGVDGVVSPSREHHAVVLAVHSWAHEPLRRLRDIVDVAAVTEGADRERANSIADSWGITRLWRTTIDVTDALLLGQRTPWALRLWARNLPLVRERTVLESHLERWLSDFWAVPTATAIRRLPSVVADEFRPRPGETWRSKAARGGRALRHARRTRSEHDKSLGGRGGDRGR